MCVWGGGMWGRGVYIPKMTVFGYTNPCGYKINVGGQVARTSATAERCNNVRLK